MAYGVDLSVHGGRLWQNGRDAQGRKWRVLDFHAHAFPPAIAPKVCAQLHSHYEIPVACSGTLEDLQIQERASGVERYCVVATATTPHQVTKINAWLAEATSAYPTEMCGFGTLHPDFDDIRGELKRIKECGLGGLKLHPDFQAFHVDGMRAMEMFRIIEEEASELPILVHSGDAKFDYSEPHRLRHVLKAFPSLKLVAAHMGGYNAWPEAQRELIGQNLYVDCSSSLWRMPPEEMLEMIRTHGAERVVFGTDYPICPARDDLERFFMLSLTDKERQLILWENANHLLGWDEQGERRHGA